MKKKPLFLVAGARPNFIKLAPLVWVLNSQNQFPYQIIHTGQHYDHAMSQTFFDLLGIPHPNVNLEVGSGEQSIQTARIMERFDELLQEETPNAIVVFGDVNSTIACSLVAAKRLIPIVHVEAGLRSFDRTMPEEINRLVTDVLADLLLVSENSGMINLQAEGIAKRKIHLVGNIMIDTLEKMLPRALERKTPDQFELEPGKYAILTLHRNFNVDNPKKLLRLLAIFQDLSCRIPFIFPVHPRTKKQMEAIGFVAPSTFRLTDPLDYLDSICLQKHAKMVLTDSGGIQEETSCLNIPCLTLRKNTERPVTVELGTSTLVGDDEKMIRDTFEQVMAGEYKKSKTIPLWDGHTAERIADKLGDF